MTLLKSSSSSSKNNNKLLFYNKKKASLIVTRKMFFFLFGLCCVSTLFRESSMVETFFPYLHSRISLDTIHFATYFTISVYVSCLSALEIDCSKNYQTISLAGFFHCCCRNRIAGCTFLMRKIAQRPRKNPNNAFHFLTIFFSRFEIARKDCRVK